MKNKIWKFVDNNGSFESKYAQNFNSLYFPLCNSYPIMASITPRLAGDLKTGYNNFLLEPVSRISLVNLKSSRNFWIYLTPRKIWSLTGKSKNSQLHKDVKFSLRAGMLWQEIINENKKIGLEAKITSFIPSSGEPVEIMRITLKNISKKKIEVTPTAAIPVYARSAHNLHDHRHVTSLLNRVEITKYGIIVKPTLLFDEKGHKNNKSSYFVFGIDQNLNGPKEIFSTLDEFCRDKSDLEAPIAVFENLSMHEKRNSQGKEAIGGLKFNKSPLKPGYSHTYIVIMGISDAQEKTTPIFNRFNTLKKVNLSLEETKKFWINLSERIRICSADSNFDNWFKWVTIQPVLRRIFGCSFLPDFDYGKGGRGWRDLWQDCLSLILINPRETRDILINNFSGVRIDGSNATIIGQKPKEFLADRNNISRVWMDHGIWPLLTLILYIHQTKDMNIVLKKVAYFKDHLLSRSKEIDVNFNSADAKLLKDKKGKTYKGSILEHILIENLVQFFNVGPHNFVRLENADWNDGLDMAPDFGESVAFSAMYAQNLLLISEIIEKLDKKNFEFIEELSLLLDSIGKERIDYSDKARKSETLKKYFSKTQPSISGRIRLFKKADLVKDLEKKSCWLSEHIRKNAWLKEGFFNGYFDNQKKRVEGKFGKIMRMTLTGQVFPIMSAVASKSQIKNSVLNIERYLRDKKVKGIRLNTDFKDEQLNLGRAFSFSYGDKENGSFFSHMNVMLAFALYKRGLVKEAYNVIDSIYRMAIDTQISKIYPCLPEYFNSQGRGMYSYLTGSASWFIYTVLTEQFGVKGLWGDLIIEPKLSLKQFGKKISISIKTFFAGKRINVIYKNPGKKDFPDYKLGKLIINGQPFSKEATGSFFKIPRNEFLKLCGKNENTLEVWLE